jgi:hypothetical protein
MLFVLIMDVLSSMFLLAEDRGLLHNLQEGNVRNRISFYADVVVLFVKPVVEDLNCVKVILDFFSSASGLVCNMNKSCAISQLNVVTMLYNRDATFSFAARRPSLVLIWVSQYEIENSGRQILWTGLRR